jgi:hypothetical protein
MIGNDKSNPAAITRVKVPIKKGGKLPESFTSHLFLSWLMLDSGGVA